jgi:membrane protein implicated in regulation of membrane protease activity
MDAVYLVSLIIGGFFVLLSILGGGDSDAEVDLDADADIDADMDSDGAGTGFVDLLSVRTLFLFAAFFGLTGVLLGLTESAEVMRFVLSLATGLVSGFGGNYLIKSVAYRNVSSILTSDDLKGKTAKVVVPFAATERGQIVVETHGQRHVLSACSFDDSEIRSFQKGDEVVVLAIKGNVASVIRPD